MNRALSLVHVGVTQLTLGTLACLVLLLACGSSSGSASTDKPGNAMCPVMTDQPTKSSLFVDYQGKRIYFCCNICKGRFTKDPAKYLANLSPGGRLAATTRPATAPAMAAELPPSGPRSSPYYQLLGKFHVVVVHFPVALLLIAAAAEWVRFRNRGVPSALAQTCLLLGAAGAVAAAVLGWIDADVNFATPPSLARTMFWHRWVGIGVAGTSLLALLAAMGARALASPRLLRAYRWTTAGCAIGVALVGHLGGTLEYGPDYYASAFSGPTAPPVAEAMMPDHLGDSPAPAALALPAVQPADDPAIQQLLFGSPAEQRLGRIKIRLATLPAAPAVPDGPTDSANPIDHFVAAKWPAGTAPPPLCDDSTFLRRVYLDLLGVTPTLDESTPFLSDNSPTKREQLVDTLLARTDEYAANWTPWFEEAIASTTVDVTGGIASHGNHTKWILESFKTNKPYDVMVRELIDPTAPGFQRKSDAKPNGKLIHIGYVLNNTHTETLQSAANVGQFFLGTGMKCASCHSHFLNDEWPQQRFLAFAGMFAPQDLESIRCEVPSGKTVPACFPFELSGAPTTMPSNLDDRLHLAAQLITDPANPQFAKTTVNRLWKRYLGLGLFEPIDDFRLDTPASHPELLEWMARDFVEHGYDLKHTIRLILTSRTYQQKYDPKLEDHFDNEHRTAPRYFRSPALRKLTAEELVDSIRRTVDQKLDDKDRLYHSTSSTSLTRVLGRPASRNEISTARSEDLAIVQSLELLNGRDWNALIYGSPILSRFSADANESVALAYRAALSRRPTAEEVSTGSAFRTAAPTTANADLLWALFSSPEFQYIR